MNLRLIVIRTNDTKRLADFYSLLGLSFDYHKHGNSPYHHSATIGETVLEIYPLANSQTGADKNLRLGLAIDNFDMVVKKLKEQGVTFFAEPSQTEFGFMTVVVDPDGRKVELYKE